MPPSFTAHNVVLDDGSQTLPERGWTLDRSPHVAIVRQFANLFFPEGLAGKSIVDLGCLEGGFATEFARLGLTSTGVEVRKSNYENCLYIKERTSFPNLSFQLDDAWNVGKYGPFDIVFCVGLYYHIDRVTEFMNVLAQNCGRMLFLDTHFAPENDDSPSVATYGLSPLTEHEGLPGRWFPEHDLETSSVELDQLKWASWENKASFWPTRPAIFQLMKRVGFDSVFESFEQLGSDLVSAIGPDGYYTTNTRSVFIGLKTG
jgi:SAM-dependent methyltransferase